MKFRLDHYLVKNYTNLSRNQIQTLIEEGQVQVNGKTITRPSLKTNLEDKIDMNLQNNYVGRGSLKLNSVIDDFNINFKDKIVADIGASTGGFTEVLLEKNVKQVWAIDVGHDQLAQKLKMDERVVNLEGINVKNSLKLPLLIDYVVVDLSFISLRLVIDSIFQILKNEGKGIFLFKPQFEIGKELINQYGPIVDREIAENSLNEFKEWCETKNYRILKVKPSLIKGKKGNQEYFLLIEKIVDVDK